MFLLNTIQYKPDDVYYRILSFQPSKTLHITAQPAKSYYHAPIPALAVSSAKPAGFVITNATISAHRLQPKQSPPRQKPRCQFRISK